MGLKKKGRIEMAIRHYKPEEIIQHIRTHELNQAKGMGKEESARKIGVTHQTLVRWSKEYAGLKVEQARKLKELEKENAKLKKIVANQALDKMILEEALKGNY